jgi:hypothetical protein
MAFCSNYAYMGFMEAGSTRYLIMRTDWAVVSVCWMNENGAGEVERVLDCAMNGCTVNEI